VVGGYLDINARAKDVTTRASGKNSNAGTSIGTVHNGTKIAGYAKIRANAGKVNTIASGKGSSACTEIGSVGDNPACGKAGGGGLGGLIGGLLPF
jgi:hypothetical protein